MDVSHELDLFGSWTRTSPGHKIDKTIKFPSNVTFKEQLSPWHIAACTFSGTRQTRAEVKAERWCFNMLHACVLPPVPLGDGSFQRVRPCAVFTAATVRVCSAELRGEQQTSPEPLVKPLSALHLFMFIQTFKPADTSPRLYHSSSSAQPPWVLRL